MNKALLFLVIAVLVFGSTGTANAHSIRLTGGTLAGQQLSDSLWTIIVSPDQDITGNILCEAYGSRAISSIVIPFGYTWTWESRETAIVTLSGNLPQSASNWDVPIDLTAPSDPGTYYILFGLRGEFNMAQIFSSTNWHMPAPVWNDGNDFHDMDDAKLSYAHDHGNVTLPILTTSGYVDYEVGVMPIKVIVSGTTATRLGTWGKIKSLYQD
jgi:hypothetical protein